MSKKEEEINRLEAEIQMIQDEIDRRHERIDADLSALSNQEKIDDLRKRRSKLSVKLASLKD